MNMKKKENETNIVTIGKKHFSKDGIWSCVFFLVETLVLIASFWNALWNVGQAGFMIGVLEFFVFIGCFFGIVFGIRGKKQKNCSHIIDEIGIASNVLLMIIIVILFIMGMSVG